MTTVPRPATGQVAPLAEGLSNRTALVTAASGGIGAGLARSLAEAGCDVAVRYSGNAARAEQTADEIRSTGTRAATGMAERGFGLILFVSSVAAFTGGIVEPRCAASKSGLHGMLYWLAKTYAAGGVTVNAIAPALVVTGMIPQIRTPRRSRSGGSAPQRKSPSWPCPC